MSRKDTRFMNGIPELLVLSLLAERERYGYELVVAIREATGEVVALGEGCLYPLLHALEEEGLLRTRKMEKAGRTRLYYRLTRAGRARLRVTMSHWQKLTRAVGAALGRKHGRLRPA